MVTQGLALWVGAFWPLKNPSRGGRLGGGEGVRFLTRYDGEVSEPLVGRQGSRVSMRVARGSASLLPTLQPVKCAKVSIPMQRERLRLIS